MAAPYLEEMDAAFRAGARDLHEVAARLGISFESACLTFNNGLLKGYWRIATQTHPDTYSDGPPFQALRRLFRRLLD